MLQLFPVVKLATKTVSRTVEMWKNYAQRILRDGYNCKFAYCDFEL